MAKNVTVVLLAVFMLLVLGPPAVVVSQDATWTGAAGDNLWNNPENWSGSALPTLGDETLLSSPAAEPNGPIITDGMTAEAGVLVAAGGTPTMSMTGGTLELGGWGSWWSDDANTTATFDMSGGTIDYTGSPGIFEMGWQPSGAEVGTSIGVWNMTGGEINAKGISIPGEVGGFGFLNLHGGTFNVGTARGGLILGEGARVDITEGVFFLEGDQSTQVADYIDEGWIVGYDGEGEVVLAFDGEFTIVGAESPVLPLLCDITGDGVCDSADLNQLLYTGLGSGDLDYDLDGNGLVDLADRDAWLVQAGTENLGTPYVPGDTDLNGQVDAADLNDLGLSWQRTDADNWSQGDFNGDGSVNASDLNDLGLSWQHGVAAAASATVPEPAGSFLLVAGSLLGLFCRRRYDSF